MTKPLPPITVKQIKNGNGEIVSVAVDENGKVVATKKQQPLAPIIVAAAAIWFFLM